MKQFRITGPYAFTLEDVPVPVPEGDQVLLKMNCLGICGSDMQIYHGKHKFMSFPVVLGHEVSAVVEEAGDNAAGFTAGDKVTLEPQVYCGSCHPCLQGRFNVCENLKVLGIHLDGCSREYAAVESRYLHKIPAGMSDDLAVLVEPFAVGVGSVRRSSRLAGGNVVVVGAGTIGNFTAQAAKALGARRVLISDISQRKLDYAACCGIDECVNIKNMSLLEAIRERFGPDRADVIIDCAGTPATFSSILDAARPNSDIVITGNFKEPVEFNVPLIQRQEISLIGHMMYVREDFKTAIDLLGCGKIITKETITKAFAFDEYQKAYEYADAESDSIMKLVIRF
jgi:L-iditol 2-dehydrogenase